LEALVVAPCLLEELREMGLAVGHSFKGGVAAKREGGLAVVALEARAVEDGAVGGELVHGVHRLGAHLALLLRPAEHGGLAADLISPRAWLVAERRR